MKINGKHVFFSHGFHSIFHSKPTFLSRFSHRFRPARRLVYANEVPILQQLQQEIEYHYKATFGLDMGL